MPDRTPPRDALRAAGLRVTEQRLAVLDALPAGEHRDADTVAAAVRAQLGSVSLQAVYNVLHALTDAGLVRHIEPAGSRATFETRVGDNHHHVVCRDCGATSDVDCAVGSAPCLEPVTAHGYVIDEAEVIYWGCCPDCQPRRSAARTPAVDPPPDSTDDADPTTREVAA